MASHAGIGKSLCLIPRLSKVARRGFCTLIPAPFAPHRQIVSGNCAAKSASYGHFRKHWYNLLKINALSPSWQGACVTPSLIQKHVRDDHNAVAIARDQTGPDASSRASLPGTSSHACEDAKIPAGSVAKPRCRRSCVTARYRRPAGIFKHETGMPMAARFVFGDIRSPASPRSWLPSPPRRTSLPSARAYWCCSASSDSSRPATAFPPHSARRA